MAEEDYLTAAEIKRSITELVEQSEALERAVNEEDRKIEEQSNALHGLSMALVPDRKPSAEEQAEAEKKAKKKKQKKNKKKPVEKKEGEAGDSFPVKYSLYDLGID